MDRRFGGPLPRQLPNPTRAHPIPPELFTLYDAIPCAYAVLADVSICCPPVWGRLPTRYSPVRHSVYHHPSEIFIRYTSFDLHVLSTPPAFILSQDQTLIKKMLSRSVLMHTTFKLSDRSDNACYLPFFTVLKVSSLKIILLEFFKVVSLFSCQSSDLLHQVSRAKLFYIIIRSFSCQGLFQESAYGSFPMLQPDYSLLILVL